MLIFGCLYAHISGALMHFLFSILVGLSPWLPGCEESGAPDSETSMRLRTEIIRKAKAPSRTAVVLARFRKSETTARA